MKPSFAPRAFRATILLLSAALSSTCAFLTDDAFPRWLSYVEASVDFRSIAEANGLGDDPSIENLEYAPFVTGGTDYSKALVFASGNSASRLLLFNAGGLGGEVALTDAGFRRALGNTAGGFLCGGAIIDPIDNSTGTPIVWNDSSNVRAFRVGDPGSGSTYAIDQNSSQQASFEEYDAAWSPGGSAIRDYDGSASMYNLLDADYANGYSVLAQLQYSGYGYAASFATALLFTTADTVFDSASATRTGPFPVADQMAWLTEGGPVAYYRGDNGRNRLIRYRWGTGDFATGAGAEELDSLLFEDDDIRILSFDPSGTWWFVFDRLSGRMYKLRTWWE